MNTRTFLTLAALLLAPPAELHAAESTFQSQHLAIGLSPSALAFSVFAVDSLGQGKLDQNAALPETNAIAGLELAGQTYQLHGQPIWRVTGSEKVLPLRSDYAAGAESHPLSRGAKVLNRREKPVSQGVVSVSRGTSLGRTRRRPYAEHAVQNIRSAPRGPVPGFAIRPAR